MRACGALYCMPGPMSADRCCLGHSLQPVYGCVQPSRVGDLGAARPTSRRVCQVLVRSFLRLLCPTS
jgi:hypothetical protein